MKDEDFFGKRFEVHATAGKVYTKEDAPKDCRDAQRYADCRNATNPPNTGEHRACAKLFC